MYIVALSLSALTVILSSLGAYFVPRYLGAEPQGGHEAIFYVVGMMATVPGLLLGIIAGAILLRLRNNEEYSKRIAVRVFWLPSCPPILVIIALNVMLIAK